VDHQHSAVSVSFHQDFVVGMHSHFFQGQVDWGLFFGLAILGKLGFPNQEKKKKPMWNQ
jgi:hypothetical protein